MENGTPSDREPEGETNISPTKRLAFSPAGQIVIGALLWGGAVALVLSASSLPGNDAYYHVAIVRKMLASGKWAITEFPWTTCSIWSEPFFDKEWFFHIFLAPFVATAGLSGAKAATVTLALLAGLSWGFLVHSLGIKRIFQCALFALAGTGYVFLARLDLCRPHLASLICLPLVLGFAVRGWKWGTAVSSCVYALSYVAAWHVVPVLAFLDILRVWEKRRGGEKAKSFPLSSIWALAGIMAGTVLSPYFPDNIRGVFIQTILILKTKWFSPGTAASGLTVAELSPIPPSRFWLHALPFTALAAALLQAIKRRVDGEKLAPTTTFSLALATAYALMAIFSRRFVEYSAPACAVAAFLFWERHPAVWWSSMGVKRKKTFAFVATATMLLALAFSGLALRDNLRKLRPRAPYLDAAAWMRSNMASGEVVFSSEWGANAPLFFLLPEQRYLVLLDPYFMRAYSKKKHLLWWKLSQGKIELPAKTIMRNFNSKVVFLPPKAQALSRQLLLDPDAELVVKGQDGEMVFLLEDSDEKK